jgi:hypothetical protein
MCIKLKDALFCVECESIFEFSENTCNASCPLCASNSYIRLATILNRKE